MDGDMGVGVEHNSLQTECILKSLENQKDFIPHSVSCAAQGGEADLKFTEMSTLVWCDFDS